MECAGGRIKAENIMGGTRMEVIKDLPEVFEEFAEQRKKSFLGVKQLKDKGIPVLLLLMRAVPGQNPLTN